jgi:hypothetical protein
MLNVTTTTKDAYKSASEKTLTIYFPALDVTFDNNDIVQESFSIEELLEADDYLTFIGCNASKATFSLLGVTTDFKNQEVEISIQAGETEPIPLFHGFIDEQTIKNYTNSICEFIAYDILYTVSNIDVARWYIQYFEQHETATIYEFRVALFDYLSIEVVPADLVNDDITFTKQYSPVQLSALTLIKYICQINGVFGIINRDGLFEFRELGDITVADDTVDYYKNLDYQRYTVSSITKVIVRQNDMVEGASAGTGSNTYIMQGNFFTLNLEDEDLEPIAENLLPIVSGKPYVPFTADIEGYPWVEVGDVLQYRVYDTATATYSNINFYVLSRKLTGIQALFDNQVAEGDKERSIFVSSIQATIDTIKDQIEAIQGKLESLELKYLMFYNMGEVDIEDGHTEVVANTRFAVSRTGQVHIEMSWMLECETTEETVDGYLTNDDLRITVMYEYDGTIIDSREPKETYQDGKHMYTDWYVINADNSRIHTWKVWMNCDGGSVHIDIFKAQNSILGLNIEGNVSWGGEIELKDTIHSFVTSGISAFANAIDTVVVKLINPTILALTDTSDGFDVPNITVAELSEHCGINEIVTNDWVDETKKNDMSYDTRYVIIDNHNFVLKTEYVSRSIGVTIDSGYCCKVTPFITGLTVEDVEINEQVSD